MRLKHFSMVVVPLLSFASAAAGQLTTQVLDADLSAMRWRLIGPHRGGRSVAVAGHPENRLVAYFGAVGGGVWKTEDGGYRWRNVSDGFFKTASVGALAIAPSNPDVVYVGMGETCIRGNISFGDGVYKSTDGGESWTHLGLEDTRNIARILVHPEDPDRIYVAAFGHPWGENEERGVYRSADGGRTWERLLFVNDKVGAIDLDMERGDPGVLYASMWEARRYPWGLRGAGPGTGIYKSTDGGENWTELTRNPGLPPGANRGRTGIAVSPARPQRVWVVMEAEDDRTGVYRSDDGGGTWELVSRRAELLQRPWYYHHIFADPEDADTVYVLNTRLWKSTDGGKTYEQIVVNHGDVHDLWIDPDDPQRIVQANDGGGTITYDGGRSWSSIYNQPTSQLYHVTTDNQFPYRVYSAQQDNSSLSVPSRSDYGSIGEGEWYAVGGGEDGYIAIKPDDSNIVIAGDHYYITRYDHRTKQVKDVSPWPEMYWGWGARDLKYRFQWVYPILFSPHDPNVLYATSQHVHRSTDQGHSWEIISPDLTRADPKTLEPTPSWGEPGDTGPYWGPIKRDNTGIEWYAVIFAFAESPVQQGVFWAASDDGVIQISRDGGKTWKEVTPEGIPEFTMMSILDASPHDAGTAYVAGTRYKLDDASPYLYKTTNYGESWTKIVSGIREGDYARAIRADTERPGLLYAGTETGFYLSFDDGEHWRPFQLNLPTSSIRDIIIKGDDVVVATHGRSIWILDDLSVLRQVTDATLASDVHLYDPAPTVRFRQGSVKTVARPGGHEARSTAEGKNPPNGAVFYYSFRETPASDVTLTVREASGELVQEFSSIPAEAGLNRFVWENMRYPSPLELPGAIFRRYRPQGPIVPPGSYQVTLTASGETRTARLDIVKDPRLEMTQDQFDEQHRFLIEIRDKITETHDEVLKMRALREQLDEAVGTARGTSQEDDITARAKSLADRLHQIEEQLVQFQAKATQDLINYPTRLHDKLSTLAALTELGDAPPTQQDYQLYRDIVQRIDLQLAKFEELEEKDWEAFQRLIER